MRKRTLKFLISKTKFITKIEDFIKKMGDIKLQLKREKKKKKPNPIANLRIYGLSLFLSFQFSIC